jgi:2-oxoglutarate dehydrogenase E2 component (dihydrolipoamide succinyltransferase)
LVSKRRRLRRKDQAIAEVDSDKATLELPAEASGIITLKAEEGDAVAVEQ